MVACPRGGEVLFAVKTMFLPYKKDSDTYGNTTLLCGERKFAATRELTQNVAAMVACPSGGEGDFAVKTMFLPYKKD